MDSERTLRVGKRGEIVIPADVRRLLGIAPGKRVGLEVEHGDIILRPKAGLGTSIWGSIESKAGAHQMDEIMAELDASERTP